MQTVVLCCMSHIVLIIALKSNLSPRYVLGWRGKPLERSPAAQASEIAFSCPEGKICSKWASDLGRSKSRNCGELMEKAILLASCLEIW
jgi:hypothetical protein